MPKLSVGATNMSTNVAIIEMANIRAWGCEPAPLPIPCEDPAQEEDGHDRHPKPANPNRSCSRPCQDVRPSFRRSWLTVALLLRYGHTFAGSEQT